MSEKLRIVVVRPGKNPAVSYISDSLKDMQRIVDGYIEFFMTTGSGIDLICNEEGKLVCLEPNRYFPELDDVICGNIIAITHDDEGASVSLSDDQVKEAMRMFTEDYPPVAFFRFGGRTIILPGSEETGNQEEK